MTKIDGQIVESDGKAFLLKGKDGYQIKLSSEQELAVQDTINDLEIRQKLGGWRSYATLIILLLANLLNYIDRYTIAGVLDDVQQYYGIDKAQAGLLQTSFIVSYMLLSPIFGYLGDRYNRKIIMAVGIGFWSVVTLAGSFVPAENFYIFLMMRALVGIGEASYSTIAPTIIADLFVKDARTKALTIFYFAIPLGSGLGYIVGSQVAIAFGGWQWALRVTPALGIFCACLIILVLKEPPRGAAEGITHGPRTSYLEDVKSLFANKSFLLGTGGFTCVAFVAGALSMWAPLFMQYAIRNISGTDTLDTSVPWKFGLITCLAGFIGVVTGSETARLLRPSRGAAGDPLVCAFGMLCSGPFLFAACYMAAHNITFTWILIFIGEVLICLNWSIVTDMLLYVVSPSRRSTAEAIQILISHALGDAGSPYLIGLISDALSGKSLNHTVQFTALQTALYITVIACIGAGAFFLINAIFINADKDRVDRECRGSPPTSNSSMIGEDDEQSTRTRLVDGELLA